MPDKTNALISFIVLSSFYTCTSGREGTGGDPGSLLCKNLDYHAVANFLLHTSYV